MGHSGRSRPSRRLGILIYAVLGLVAVVGILLVALDSMARQRNRLAHRAEYGRIAEGLADGAVSYLQLLMRQESWGRVASTLPLPLTDGNLYAFLLQPSEELEAKARLPPDGWLEKWFGPEWRTPLADLERAFPSARIEIAFEVEAEPLHPGGSFSDPLEKTVDWGLVVTATYQGVSRTLRRVYAFKVVHPFPPVTSKFTLFVDRLPGNPQEFNVLSNDEGGNPTGSPARSPFVLLNTPLADPSDRTLIRANVPNVEQGRPWAGQDALRDALDRRGYVYLGTGAGNPGSLELNLTAGPSLFQGDVPVPMEGGEFFHLYDPERYDSQPTFFRLLGSAAPGPFQGPVTEPGGSVKQPYVNFLFWGFHDSGSDDLDAAKLGSSLGTKRSSVLHLFGNDDEPSRTRVFGPVVQAFPRLSYLGVDRKVGADAAGPDDEEIQRANLAANGLDGRFRISERDSTEPIFAHVPSEAAWNEDLDREVQGQAMVYLDRIPTTQSGLPPPANRNFARDADGDGLSETILDPGFPWVTLDGAVFNYRSLFPTGYTGSNAPGQKGYQNYMSTVLRVPYNQVTDYMVYGGVIPPEEHPAFPGTWTAGADLDALASATAVELGFGDPIHAHYRIPTMFQGDLSAFFGSGEFEAILRRRATAQVPDQSGLFARFPLASSPVDPTGPPWLVVDEVVLIGEGGLDLPPLAYQGGGTLVVARGDVRLRGMVPRQSSFLSVVALEGDIILEGRGPHVGLFAAPKGRLVNGQGSELFLEGALATGTLESEPISRGGWIRYDSSADPTRYDSQSGLAYADFYQAELSAAPIEWTADR